MGLLGKLGKVIVKVDESISSDPEIVGKRFEDHVEKLFSKQYFKLIEKTHSFDTNKQRYVESSLNPDFIWEYAPTKDKFAVECKFRTTLNNKNQIVWSNPQQLQRYQEFERKNRIPVFVVIGFEDIFENDFGDEESEKFMFCLPLKEAKYPALYESVFTKFERDYDKPFFWKNGFLY
jgi:hypothetical protein